MPDTLQDVLMDIESTEAEEPEQKDDLEEAPTSEEVESPSAEDEPGQDPDAEEPEPSEDEPEEGEPEDDQAEPEEPDAEETDEEDEGPEEETVVVDGEEVPLSTVREWRDGRNEIKGVLSERLGEARQEAEQLRELTQKQTQLVADLTSDRSTRELIQNHPELLGDLIQAPEEARGLIGNARAVQRFQDDYEFLLENPEQAERLASGDPEAQEEVSEQAELQQVANHAVWVANGMKTAVQAVANHFADEHPEVSEPEVLNEVENELMKEFGGVDPEGDFTADELVQAMNQLESIFFKKQNGETVVDPRLIAARFDRRLRAKQSRQEREEARAEEHNKQVDEALQDEAPPSSPKGKAPLAEEEPEEDFESFGEILESLR